MLSDLLRQTAQRYDQARKLVMSEHPSIADMAEREFEQLVADAVQRLANQGSHLEKNETKRGLKTTGNKTMSGGR
jgi:hypothetical protein